MVRRDDDLDPLSDGWRRVLNAAAMAASPSAAGIIRRRVERNAAAMNER
jgi:hypothetical protein